MTENTKKLIDCLVGTYHNSLRVADSIRKDVVREIMDEFPQFNEATNALMQKAADFSQVVKELLANVTQSTEDFECSIRCDRSQGENFTWDIHDDVLTMEVKVEHENESSHSVRRVTIPNADDFDLDNATVVFDDISKTATVRIPKLKGDADEEVDAVEEDASQDSEIQQLLQTIDELPSGDAKPATPTRHCLRDPRTGKFVKKTPTMDEVREKAKSDALAALANAHAAMAPESEPEPTPAEPESKEITAERIDKVLKAFSDFRPRSTRTVSVSKKGKLRFY